MRFNELIIYANIYNLYLYLSRLIFVNNNNKQKILHKLPKAARLTTLCLKTYYTYYIKTY